jgi:hypothetical protein
MAIDLTKLTASAERITNAKDAVLAFIQGVPGLVRDAIAKDDISDAANINALADRFEADAVAITNAIVAGTPAEEPPAGEELPPVGGEEGGGGSR